ncbi:hypothetical protein QWY84_11135 [Aquisalimonas lutea]|uniref:hypothetical protein n=1 Tax=Aquisalimonas lutea TaxID=1327750 RepID=UPI0025B2C8AA|nr:hypothetical protein [Aquisalimonas lutea]MDN3518165.1 hypothetical protein [Aquisalimonas lutea]
MNGFLLYEMETPQGGNDPLRISAGAYHIEYAFRDNEPVFVMQPMTEQGGDWQRRPHRLGMRPVDLVDLVEANALLVYDHTTTSQEVDALLEVLLIEEGAPPEVMESIYEARSRPGKAQLVPCQESLVVGPDSLVVEDDGLGGRTAGHRSNTTH